MVRATETGPSSDELEALDEWKNWDAKSREKAAAALQEAMDGKKRRVWYCKRGRTCDGQPHDQYDYPHARSDQWPPPGLDWLTWLLMGGRGSGKTRSGAEWTRKKALTTGRMGVMGPTTGHVRDVIVEGESGLLACFDAAKMKVLWEPSKHRITLPNGNLIQTYTGEEPDRLRGRQHGSFWIDEPAHIPLIEVAWDNIMLGLRLGKATQMLCTTTPLPTKWMKDLVAADDTVTVKASTYVNLGNLAPAFRKQVLQKYEGTRLGRQELYGDILEDVEGAMWTWDIIETNREPDADYLTMDRIVVGIDPAGTSKGRDETGIVVIGIRGDHLYLLADYSGHMTPNGWANAAWNAYDHFEADAIVAEKNYGGEMVLSTLRNVRVDGNIKLVNSRRGKVLRAEPIVALYEQEKFHHVGIFEDVETQQTEWVPGVGDSPDRVDALVHAATELAKPGEATNIATPTKGRSRAGSRVDVAGIPRRRGLYALPSAM